MTDTKKINENVIEVEAKNEKDEGGILADIAEGLKENWWKILVGAATAVASFTAGYKMGSDSAVNDEAPAVEEDDAPFDTDEVSE